MKFGVLDINAVFEKSRRGRELTQRLQTSSKVWQRKRQTLEEQRQRLAAQLEPQAPKKIGPQEAMTLQRDLQGIDMELNYTRQRADAELKAQVQQSQEFIMQELAPILAEYAKSNGYTAVFTLPATPLLYVDASADITTAVIAFYDQRVKL